MSKSERQVSILPQTLPAAIGKKEGGPEAQSRNWTGVI